MRAPQRPEILLEPQPADFTEQAATNVTQALLDLYEAAFGNADRNAKMDQAHAAPAILAHAAMELFHLRRENLALRSQLSDPPSRWGTGLRPVSDPPSAPGHLGGFPDLVAAELARARRTFPPLTNVHEAHSVILEEFDEFWDEAKRRYRSAPALLKELIQTAAMCQRAAEDLQLLPQSEPRP